MTRRRPVGHIRPVPKERLPQHTKILIGLGVGAAAGIVANLFWSGSPQLEWLIKNLIYPFGQIFLRLIFMIVIPLIVSALALGTAEMGDLRKLGKIGAKTLAYTVAVSTVSVIIGITLVNLFKPGEGISAENRAKLEQTFGAGGTQKTLEQAAEAKSWSETLLDIIPKNPFADMAGIFSDNYKGGGVLAVMFFAIFLGIALSFSKSDKVSILIRFLEGVFEVVMTVIRLAMKLAPYAVAALIFSVTARLGFSVVATLGKYVFVVLFGLALHQFGVYSLILRFIAKVSPIKFFRSIDEVMAIAFSTSSSNATLPDALRVSEEKVGVPREINSFVLTLGSTANQNGTALYEGVTVLFLAQFFGVDLSLGQQVTVIFASILAGIGTAGVPGGSLPFIVLLLSAVGIPGEGIGIILGVDRILDMCRTVVNVTGDLTAAAVIAKTEGHTLKVS
ncbi:MAG: dicarboxylate/amino acid:cation symporter [candidate division Zixibacteria bacterium]|nr:dicarboxylate/amino acid:cation symporter [candidate division Zixibacteria bacterium]